MNKGVTVIVCCHNSIYRLPETLKHLAQQQVDKRIHWEVILVDNNSTDGTSDFVKSTWNKYNTTIPIHIVSEKQPGLSEARKKGINSASYDYILFCDDDNWLDETYIEKVFNRLESDPKIGALGGQGFAVSETNLPDWFEKYKSAYACGPQSVESGYISKDRAYLYGAGVAYRRKILQAIFKQKLILTGRKGKKLSAGDDSEISMKAILLGYQLYYDEELTFKHEIPAKRLTFTYLEKLFEGFGRAHYYLYPLQKQILKDLNQKPNYPKRRAVDTFTKNLKNICFYLFTKKHFSGTVSGAWAWGLVSEVFKLKNK